MERPENVKFILNDIKSNILDMYVTNLEKENEKLNIILQGLANQKYEEKCKNAKIVHIDYVTKEKLQERINKAIEIYENRNSIKFKKQRFMEDKDTVDLMYDILKGEE